MPKWSPNSLGATRGGGEAEESAHGARARMKPIVFHKPNILTKSSCLQDTKPGTAELENEIKVHMNKITMTTYERLFGKIRDILLNDAHDPTSPLMRYMFRRVFECASMNAALLDIYVRLFRDLQVVSEHDVCVKVSQSLHVLFLADIDEIKSFDPQTEYDEYCKESKKNDRRRNTSRFYCELHKAGHISTVFYHSLLKDIYTLLIRYIRCDASGHIVNELADNLHVLLLHSANDSTRDIYARYFPEIAQISKVSCSSGTKHELYTSVTNKCVFKCRDIVETYARNRNRK